MKTPAVVEVQWTDAASYASSTVSLAPDCHRNRHCQLVERRHTIGYLIYRDKRRTVLAHDYDPPDAAESHGEAGNMTVIPTPWITKITTLRKGDWR